MLLFSFILYPHLTNLPGVGPADRLVGGQRGEERVRELRHQHVHVEERIHLHGCRCVTTVLAGDAPRRRRHLFILTMGGDTEHVRREFPKQ